MENGQTAPFIAAVSDISTCLRAACGVEVIWKDADPHRWPTWPVHLSQHRNAYCRAIKANAGRLQSCIAADTAPPTDHAPVQRRCPYALREVVVPMWRHQQLYGWCFVGGWRDHDRTPDHFSPAASAAWRDLPPWNHQRAAAVGEIARRMIEGILHLRPGSTSSNDNRLQHCYALIDQQLNAGLRAHHIASWLDLSTSRFVHWFKEASGEPVSTYLQRRMMELAAQRLLSESTNITTLAFDLGFRSPSVFSTAFKKWYGHSPSQWRRQIKQAAE